MEVGCYTSAGPHGAAFGALSRQAWVSKSHRGAPLAQQRERRFLVSDGFHVTYYADRAMKHRKGRFDLRNVLTLRPSTDPHCAHGLDVVLSESHQIPPQPTKQILLDFGSPEELTLWLALWSSAVETRFLDPELLPFRDAALALVFNSQRGRDGALPSASRSASLLRSGSSKGSFKGSFKAPPLLSPRGSSRRNSCTTTEMPALDPSGTAGACCCSSPLSPRGGGGASYPSSPRGSAACGGGGAGSCGAGGGAGSPEFETDEPDTPRGSVVGRSTPPAVSLSASPLSSFGNLSVHVGGNGMNGAPSPAPPAVAASSSSPVFMDDVAAAAAAGRRWSLGGGGASPPVMRDSSAESRSAGCGGGGGGGSVGGGSEGSSVGFAGRSIGVSVSESSPSGGGGGLELDFVSDDVQRRASVLEALGEASVGQAIKEADASDFADLVGRSDSEMASIRRATGDARRRRSLDEVTLKADLLDSLEAGTSEEVLKRRGSFLSGSI